MGFAKAGATVIIADRDLAGAETVQAEIRATGGRAEVKQVDVSLPTDPQRIADELTQEGHLISILINNAGIIARSPMESADFAEQWRRVHAVNVEGMMLMTQAFLPHLKQSKGAIVNTASIQSFVSLPTKTSAYAASKGAVMQMTKAFAAELAEFGIRVNAIAPGVIATPLSAASQQNPERMAYFHSRIPMPRIGTPEDLVGPVLFLSSPLAAYVTGIIMPVDGGFLAL